VKIEETIRRDVKDGRGNNLTESHHHSGVRTELLEQGEGGLIFPYPSGLVNPKSFLKGKLFYWWRLKSASST
jgi:hypothetical protein